MNCYSYTKNKADCGDIETHMRQCSGLFNPPLAEYVNIHEYAKKIRSNAVTIEAWMNGDLIGLVACYLNNLNTFDGYITNVSVIQEHQGKGIASILVNKTIETAIIENFKTLSLEVEVENKKAVDLYRKTGFVLNGRRGDKYLMINRLLESNDILVSICCVTYNHAKYIREAIEGFLIQKVNFAIEILIHDDASIDGTSDIIREYEKKYPEIIKPIYQTENQYSQGRTISAVYQFPRVKGKYIAMCEGDDYWTDPYKLQKQVDFLEANPAYGLVCTNYGIYYQNNQRLEKNFISSNFNAKYEQDIYLETYITKRHIIRTLTVLFRSEFLKTYHSEVSENIRLGKTLGDNQLWSYILYKSKGKYLPDSTSVYRVSDNTASRESSEVKVRKHKRDVSGLAIDIAKEFKLPRRIIKELEIKNEILEIQFNVLDRQKTYVLKKFIILIFKYGKLSKSTIKLLLMGISDFYFNKNQISYFK